MSTETEQFIIEFLSKIYSIDQEIRAKDTSPHVWRYPYPAHEGVATFMVLTGRTEHHFISFPEDVRFSAQLCAQEGN